MVIFVLQYPSSLALLLQPPCWPIMRFLVNSESPSGGQRASASPGARRADAAGFRFKAAQHAFLPGITCSKYTDRSNGSAGPRSAV